MGQLLALRRHYYVGIAVCMFLLLGVSANPKRGVAPQDLSYFQGQTIHCRDNSKSIPIARVNDDFCDCVDGTDEPGTSACPTGKFYCRNRGFRPKILSSTFVNDGICDCCDGSDEWQGVVSCANKCMEEGAESRQKLAKDVQEYGQGLDAKRAIEADANKEYESLKAKLDGLVEEEQEVESQVSKLTVRKEAVEKAEKEQREWEQQQEEKRKHEEAAAKAAAGDDGAPPEGGAPAGEQPAEPAKAEGEESAGASDTQAAGEQEPIVSKVETEEAPAADVVTDGAEAAGGEGVAEGQAEPHEESAPPASEAEKKELTADEIGEQIRARWTGGGGSSPPSPVSEPAVDKVEDEAKLGGDEPDDDDDDDDDLADLQDDTPLDNPPDLPEDEDLFDHSYGQHEDTFDEDKSFGGDTDPEEYRYGGGTPPDEEPDTPPPPPPPPTSTVSKWWTRVVNLFGAGPPKVDKPEAEKIKAEHKAAVERQSKLKSEIKALKKRLEADLGPNRLFWPLYQQCFEFRQKQYVYKICPFESATQQEGHISTRLGSWVPFKGGDYSVMHFKHGETCWNGPERSMTVKLRCGVKTELNGVEEPSRCEYSGVLTTPLACHEDEGQALKMMLEEKQKELQGDPAHDELR